MSVDAERSFRIGTVAERLGVTTRTIRYYEELGLLGGSSDRCKGAHRLYGEPDIAHLQQVLRMKDLLGLSLEEIVDLAHAEETRAALRDELAQTQDPAERKRILEELLTHISGQLDLVQTRLTELTDLAAELSDKQNKVRQKIREIDGE